MSEKGFNTRIVNKHDTEANWNTAGRNGFIPKHGEWILYDPDESYDHVRVKVGDGETPVHLLRFITFVSGSNSEVLAYQGEASGYGTIAGTLGYFYDAIYPDSTNNTTTFVLCKNQKTSGTEVQLLTSLNNITGSDSDGNPRPACNYDAANGRLAYANNDKQYNFEFTVNPEKPYLVTMKGKVLTQVVNVTSLDSDDYSIHCPEQPMVGDAVIKIASHSEGLGSNATGSAAHAEGAYSYAYGDYSHAEGWNGTTAYHHGAHAEGRETKAYGNSSHTEGGYTKAYNHYAHAEGEYAEAKGNGSHAEGRSTKTDGAAAHAEGKETIAKGTASHAEGVSAQATKEAAHAEGKGTKATEIAAHAEGVSTEATKEAAHAEGKGSIATGTHSHAEGLNTKATGDGAHTEGVNTRASGTAAHAEGAAVNNTATTFTFTDDVTHGTQLPDGNTESKGSDGKITHVRRLNNASGTYAHSEGYNTTAMGGSAHAEGQGAIARGAAAHAEGQYTQANGTASHAEGYNTLAKGDYAHAEGKGTQALAKLSHAEGEGSIAYSYFTHAEGNKTIAGNATKEGDGRHAHAEGLKTQATRTAAHAEGGETQAIAEYAHAEGRYTLAQGTGAHAEGARATGSKTQIKWTDDVSFGNYKNGDSSETPNGDNNTKTDHIRPLVGAKGSYAHTEGLDTSAVGNQSHAEGSETIARGGHAHAEGIRTQADGSASHAEGNNTYAKGNNSHAEGKGTLASGSYSHAEGEGTKATNYYAHAEGRMTLASGGGSHAEGYNTTAIGSYSHAGGSTSTAGNTFSFVHGLGLSTNADNQVAFGKYNKADDKALFMIGNGINNTDKRHNAFAVYDESIKVGDTELTADNILQINGKIVNNYIDYIDCEFDGDQTLSYTFDNPYTRQIQLSRFDIKYVDFSYLTGSPSASTLMVNQIEINSKTYDLNVFDPWANIKPNSVDSVMYAEGYIEFKNQRVFLHIGTWILWGDFRDENGQNIEPDYSKIFKDYSDGLYETVGRIYTDGTCVIVSRTSGNYIEEITDSLNPYIAKGIIDISPRDVIKLHSSLRASDFESELDEPSLSVELPDFSIMYSGIDSSVGRKGTGFGAECFNGALNASGKWSHAEGYDTLAYGDYAHAGGLNSDAKGRCSFAHGENLAAKEGQFVIGKNNAETTDAIFIIGDSQSEEYRHNLMTVSGINALDEMENKFVQLHLQSVDARDTGFDYTAQGYGTDSDYHFASHLQMPGFKVSHDIDLPPNETQPTIKNELMLGTAKITDTQLSKGALLINSYSPKFLTQYAAKFYIKNSAGNTFTFNFTGSYVSGTGYTQGTRGQDLFMMMNDGLEQTTQLIGWNIEDNTPAFLEIDLTDPIIATYIKFNGVDDLIGRVYMGKIGWITATGIGRSEEIYYFDCDYYFDDYGGFRQIRDVGTDRSEGTNDRYFLFNTSDICPNAYSWTRNIR